MRKTLIFVFVAALVLGITGFAAALTVGSKYFAAGHADVVSCDTDGVMAEYGSEFDNGRFEVTTVGISRIDPACYAGMQSGMWQGLKVALTSGSSLLAVEPLSPSPLGPGQVEIIDFTSHNIAVSDVTGVDVLITG